MYSEVNMAQKWYFSKEELKNSPSFKDGVSTEKELDHKQQAAYLINDLGKRLKLSEVCTHTATVYMHRFYTQHSLSKFHRYEMAMTAIFVAAKVQEEPQKLKDVINAFYRCLKKDMNYQLDTTAAEYQDHVKTIILNERILLATLGFRMGVNHPHKYIMKFCQEINACKELCKIFLQVATNTLQMTSMCVKYKPAVVAAFCIYLTIRSSQWKIPEVLDGNPWFWLLDRKVTFDLLIKMDREFKEILNKISPRIKNRVMRLFKNPTGQLILMNRKERCSSSSDQENVSAKAEIRKSSRRKISYHEYLDRLTKKKSANSDGSSVSSPEAEEIQDNSVGSTSSQLMPVTTADVEVRIGAIGNYSYKRKHDDDTGSIFVPVKKRKLS